MLFISKLFSISKDFNFCLEFLVMSRNGLIRKIRLISKFMTSQPGYQTISIQILTNISRSKANQAMKFGQLTEYSMRNIFLEKSYTKCDGDTIPRPFSKKSKLSISLDQWSNILYCLFLLHAKLRTIKIINNNFFNKNI